MPSINPKSLTGPLNVRKISEKASMERVNEQDLCMGTHFFFQQHLLIITDSINIFGKTLIEACISYLYASFGTFCIQIGQLFAAQ